MNSVVPAEMGSVISKKNGHQKAAALLLAMGSDKATRVLKHFDNDEMRMIIRAAADLGTVPASELDELIEEFIELFSGGVNLFGTAEGAESLLKGILPEDQVAEIMSDVMGYSKRSIWDKVSQISEHVLSTYLQKEHPQTAAVILSKISASGAARVISQIPRRKRNQIVRRMLTLKPIVEDVMEEVQKTLHEDFMVNFARTVGTDAHVRMADILNKMERDDLEDTLGNLREALPKSAEQLDALLFTFDDIQNLDLRTRTAIFDDVTSEVITAALKGTNPEFRQAILASMASRARRIVENDLASGEPMTQREVMDARRAITDLALEKANAGEIDLEIGRGEEVYV
ncbi:flagellar motor switch protein G [Pseudovibrio sp. FO-BEG1]|uniref:Flagellar motor switch protein FliG n=2 Tax=Pseudovibrio TaxID=258255 RepID=A0A1I6Y6E4_9HYPH|nr:MULTISPECIES: flagellar motor switch protein FliG [Pseudovibrio]AEV37107.1 flagellar motor switch protein G [Pseudovibrio sp. FO-BEG1]EEA92626.1 probable flagellar motor switch protein [Pseudovibrio sp. JE062]QUS57425.1 flagellar motor switch protein FliG [Pseudovibrio brasiliensis]SFT46013.1 flagellar motor switch protein FliG [Pseudovibrio denitrificans]